MYDYGLSVLSHYGLTASGTMRVRGALLCHTEQGDKLISEFGTAAEKLEQRYLLQCRITESGLLRCDQILRNEEGALATRGDDGGTYIVRNWYPGRECETGNSEDLIRALGRAGAATYGSSSAGENGIPEGIPRRGVHPAITWKSVKSESICRRKRRKMSLKNCCLQALVRIWNRESGRPPEMKTSSYEKLRQRADEEGAVCHGEFASTIFCWKTGRGETAVNFDKWNFDLQVADLGYFMRKILEKHGWSERAAERILNAYSARRPLEEGEIETLRLYLSYPWKYWKLANRYYGSRKSWISGRNTEKLKTLNAQQADWLRFVKGSFF